MIVEVNDSQNYVESFHLIDENDFCLSQCYQFLPDKSYLMRLCLTCFVGSQEMIETEMDRPDCMAMRSNNCSSDRDTER
jgi:hypothetical protein